MVRNYKRKKETPYTRENLLKAVEEVKSKRLSSYQAAEKFNVPRATIYAHVIGTRGIKKSTPGRSTVFSKDTELRIANCIGVLEKCGYPLTRKEVLSLISEYIRRNGIVTIFKNDIPGDDWFRGFRKRHNLSLKKPQAVEVARRKACNPFTVYEYFDILEKVIRDLNLTFAPDCIYNLDETSFCLDPTKTKVVGKIGQRCTRTISSPGRSNTTVLLAANANGDKVPPLIVFQGKYLWTEWFYPNEKVKTAYAVSQKGWMECSLFEKYIKDVFVPAIGSKRPVLLIFDGSKTHIDLNIIELAISEEITILKLPPHSTDVLQPLDCSVMKAMKDRWDVELIKWQRMHVGFKLPKKEFATILTGIWDNLNPVIISNGFRKTGIYPTNRNMIHREKFDPLMWEQWENRINQNQSLPKGKDNSKSKADDAEIEESGDSESTTSHVVAIDLHTDDSLLTKKNFQKIPSLSCLSVKILNQSIDLSQKDNSNDGTSKKINDKKAKSQIKATRNYQKMSVDKEIVKDHKWNENEDKENYSEKKTEVILNTYEQKQTTVNHMKNKIGEWKKINNPRTFIIPSHNNVSNDISSTPTPIKILHNEVINKPPQKDKENNKSSTTLKVIQNNSSKDSSPSIKILHNLVTQPPATENTFQEVDVTLEKLVLNHIARNDLPKKPKKRVGAEILTYSDVVARMKKAKEEQERKELTKRNKQKQQKQKKRNKGVETKAKTIKTKHKHKMVNNKKKWKSDSESTGSYRSIDSSETEDMDNFFENIINEAEEEEQYSMRKFDEYKLKEKPGTSKNDTVKKEHKILEKKKMQNRKGKEKRIKDKKSEHSQKGVKGKKVRNDKWNSDSESTGSYRSVSSSETKDMDTFFGNIINEAEEEEQNNMCELDEYKLKEKPGTSKMNTVRNKKEIQKKNKKQKPKNGKEKINENKFSENLHKGIYVLARFASYKGKREYKYVCLIEEIYSGKIVVQGFKSIKNSKNQFRLVVNDVSIIGYDDVIECLPEPDFNEQNMLYTFPKDINIAEK